MSNRKKTSQLTFVILLNIVFIVLLTLGINQYIKKSIDEVIVYSYVVSLPPDTQIKESDIEAIPVSSKTITSDTVRNKEEVVGKFTKEKVYEGDLVDKRKVVGEGQVDPLSELSEKEARDMRKISIPVDLITTWGGNLSKGDRVDLSFTKDTDEYTYSKIFMQNVLVYDVLSSAGESYIKPKDRPPIVIDNKNPESAEAAQAEIERRGDLVMAILAVTPEQYEEIRTRMEVGTINLVGRFDNTESRKTDGFAIGEVKDPTVLGEDKVEDKDTIIIKTQKKSDW